MIEINRSGSPYITLYNDISELKKYITTKPHKSGRNKESDKNDEDWTGTKNFDEAINLLTYGDDKLFKKVLEKKKNLKIDNLLADIKNKMRYENKPYGYIPNVPAYLTGNPMNMINREENEISHKILNIFLDVSISGGTNKEVIITNGILYLSVIDLLEKAGYRCNLYSGTSSTTWGDGNFHMYARVKTDKEPLNIKKICFTIAHPSWLRRIYFRWAEVFDNPADITGGYGRNLDKDKAIEDLKSVFKDNIILWNYHSGHTGKSVENILKELEEQGIKIS